ncbi:MAG: DUF5107 domain-containing protein [Anaerolineae bacterium]
MRWFGKALGVSYNRRMRRCVCPRQWLLTRWFLVAVLLPSLIACRRPPAVPTPPPSVVAPARVAVLSEPAGAVVSVAGQLRGETPLELELAPGTHEISLSRDGYSTEAASVTVAAGEALTVSRELEDIAPPTVSLDLAKTTVLPQGGLKVQAGATDNGSALSLRLYLGGELVAEAAGGRLIHNLDTRALVPGTYELRVVAEDAAGNESERRARFAVRSPASATPWPSPTAGSTSVLPTATPEVAATATSEPQVVAWWDEITLETMGYRAGLYTDPEGVGHPYPLLDRGAMTPPEPVVYRVLRVRNRYLDLTFLPELGGRLYQARFLPTGQDLFWTAPMLKPTHWGPLDQGWWLAVGGMEWCLPVDEHGYLTAEPWDVVPISREDGGVTVRISTLERTRNMRAEIDVTLMPGEAALRIGTRLENLSEAPVSYQYWMNAILSPGAKGIGPDLRFVVPADGVTVHSSGDPGLPDAHGVMGWPVHGGRDMRIYGNWRNWLGFFATEATAPYTAIYSPETALGMARVYPQEVARGAKLFAFARDFADVGAYTDDGTHYVEMWGGVTPTFWDYATLGAGEALQWDEAWWVLAGSDVPCAVSAHASLSARMTGEAIEVTVASPALKELTCQVLRGEDILHESPFTVRPDAPWTGAFPLAPGDGQITVWLADANGMEVLRCTP